jgi:hypothetical protein
MFLDAVPRQYETFDEGDPRAYGADGVVRDGVRLRCKMTAMDAAPPQRSNSVPMQIRTGLPLRGPDSLARHYHIDGSP